MEAQDTAGASSRISLPSGGGPDAVSKKAGQTAFLKSGRVPTSNGWTQADAQTKLDKTRAAPAKHYGRMPPIGVERAELIIPALRRAAAPRLRCHSTAWGEQPGCRII